MKGIYTHNSYFISLNDLKIRSIVAGISPLVPIKLAAYCIAAVASSE